MMNVLTGEDNLTVYNGLEGRLTSFEDLQEGVFDIEACCGIEGNNQCKFQSKPNEDLLKWHSQLLLGIPFKIEEETDAGLRDCFQWTPLSVQKALDKAIEAVTVYDSLEIMNKMKYSYEDELVYTAINLVRLFIQLNYTGPEIDSKEIQDKLQTLEKLMTTKHDAEIKERLLLDGELENHVLHPYLLVLATQFFTSLKSHVLAWPFYLIWQFRVKFLHQKILTRRSTWLCQVLKFYADSYTQWSLRKEHTMSEKLLYVHASFLCEIAEMLNYYYDALLSEKFIQKAIKDLQITVEYTGKLGFRTKFQKDPLPQTVVSVASNVVDTNTREAIKNSRVFPEIDKWIPRSLDLNDDTRLERLKLVDESEIQIYRDIDQHVLLGLMLHKKGTCKEDADLKRQEIEALINVILDCPVSWSGRIRALVARCDVEKSDRRAVDRSMRQLDAISSSIPKILLDASDAVNRQYLFFGSGHPLKTDIKILFGEVLLTMDHWKEALNVFTELNAFEQIVRCYVRVDMRHKAEALIQQKIEENGKSPKLLILLGDVTDDLEYYEEAWKLSNHKAIEAVIKLGNHYFRIQEFAKAAEYLKCVVDRCELEYPSWVKLAWSYYQQEKFSEAYHAYLRAANLEYDNFQVWNNLATCALKTNQKEYALRAYLVAVKCSFDEWKVWSNILFVASDLGNINEAVNAYHRVLDLNKTFSSGAVLNKLSTIAISDPKAHDLNVNVLDKLTKLFGRITSMSSQGPIVWISYGRLLADYMYCTSVDEEKMSTCFVRAVHCFDKALALMRQNPGWRTDVSELENIAKCIAEYGAIRKDGSKFGENILSQLKPSDVMLDQTVKQVYEVMKGLSEQQPALAKPLESSLELLKDFLDNPFVRH